MFRLYLYCKWAGMYSLGGGWVGVGKKFVIVLGVLFFIFVKLVVVEIYVDGLGCLLLEIGCGYCF